MTRLVAIPVDARPVVRSQVQDLVRAGGAELVMPPKSLLGHLREPAPVDELWAWLQAEAAGAQGLVLSLDMLVYGGLVPSRFVETPFDVLHGRLQRLRAIQQAHGCPVFAFAATMRISNNDLAEEEKLYWAEHGRAIWSWSYHTDRARGLGLPEDVQRTREAEAKVPAALRSDYLATRERNHRIVKAALALVEEGVIDRLVLPQDDTAEWGFNIAERRELQAMSAARGLQDRVAILPGADEVMHTLCARAVAQLEGRRPLRAHLLCSDPDHVGGLIARYEDRPLLQSLAAQMAAVGIGSVDDPAAADFVLGLHSQGNAQGDWAMQLPLPARPAPLAPFVEQLRSLHQRGLAIVVADLAFANGADPLLIAQLPQALPLRELAAYAGWNTASNALGGVLAQAALHLPVREEPLCRDANRHNLALRLLEDHGWQAITRQVLRLGEAPLEGEALRHRAGELFIAPANLWARAHGLGWKVAKVDLPWGRSFEIDITLEPDEALA